MSRRTSLVAALLVALAGPSFAHDGPPYPILVDEPIDGAKLSIWADPDVGVGTFYLYLDGDREGFAPPNVRVAVTPLDVEAEELTFEASPAPEEQPYDTIAEVDFDHRGPWRARFLLDEAAGVRELVLDVDVTPPGLGTIDLLWFLSPFLAIGFLWLKVVLSRRRGRADDLELDGSTAPETTT